MRSQTQPAPNCEAYRPRPAALRRVHALRRHKGKLAAIEPRSGDYFIGDTLLAAVQRGRERYPGAIFYVVRIGHETAYVHHDGPRKNAR
jgi:hypothetical protein